MDYLAPLGPVYQAGTLSGNPLAMAAGIATLRELIANEEVIYPALEKTTAAIADGVAGLARAGGRCVDGEPGGVDVYLVLYGRAGHGLRQCGDVGHRSLWPVPPGDDGGRCLAAAIAV